jgi:diguanylate cyclase (GGDEF)-like protein
VFTDLDMPRLNGYGLLQRIRGAADARIREMPVVVISGNEDPAAKQRAKEAGANDFISKSADAPEVLSRIDNLLRMVSAAKTATHDPVTGTVTPHYLVTEGRKHFAHARRHGGELSVMALRLESHAEILRAAGKEIADVILARVAKLLLAKVRAEDSVARVQEGTFMVIAAGTAAPQIEAVGERLRRELADAKVTHKGQTFKFPSRLAVASILADKGETIEDLMRVALRRLDEKPAAAKPAAPAAPAAAPLPAELDAALTRLESADWDKLAGVGPEVMRRLQRIAAKLKR